MTAYITRQVLFSRYKWRLLKHAEEKGLFITEAEGCLASQRKSRSNVPFEDGVHMRGSAHYERMATEFMLYDDKTGAPVFDGTDPRWVELGEYWLALDPFLCRWGGNWDRDDTPFEANEHDANHFSVVWQGVM